MNFWLYSGLLLFLFVGNIVCSQSPRGQGKQQSSGRATSGQSQAERELSGQRSPTMRLYRYPVVGAVTDRSASVMVWMEAAGTVRIEYAADSAFTGSLQSAEVDVRQRNDHVARVELEGLNSSTRYYYRVLDAEGNPISKVFSFRTFPVAGVDSPVTILFGSCQQSREGDLGRTFTVASRLGGDLFVQLGDWTYPDFRIPGYPSSPGTLPLSYAMRLDTAYPFARDILSQMGLAYVWDDHDFTGNNSDGAIDPDLKQSIIDAYRRYIPHYPLPNEKNGIWQSARIGNVELFMIDARSQRRPAEEAFEGRDFVPSGNHSMLAGYPIDGIDQRRWLLDAIRRSTARWKILVSPVFFNPAVGRAIPLAAAVGRPDVALELADKWIGYPADLDSMRALFGEGLDRGFLIISGDAHTNLYDDGAHSLVPEFMVGNLDKGNSSLFGLLKQYGFNVWTEGQTGTQSTVGRIRVETSPHHRLVVESFGEDGKKVLTMELPDDRGKEGE